MASSVDMMTPKPASEGISSDSDDNSSSVIFRLQSHDIDQHLPSGGTRNGAKLFGQQESMLVQKEQVRDTMTGPDDIYGGLDFDIPPRRIPSTIADIKLEGPRTINGQRFAAVPVLGLSMIDDVISPTSRHKRAREEGYTEEFSHKRRDQRESDFHDPSEDSAFDKFIIPSDATIIDLTDSPPSSSKAVPNAGPLSPQPDALGDLHRPEVTLPCVSCGDDFDVTLLAHMACEHDYCQECLQTMVTNALQDEDLYPPKCCKKPFEMDDMRTLLSPELISGFHEKKMEFETANRIYCSSATCSAFLYPVNITGDKALCPICLASTCTICKGPEHDGDCPQDSAVQEVLEMANGQGWRRCPQCKSVVELGTGCNHITCRCKAQWCYLCGAPWRTCRCPQSTGGRLDGALNIAGAELDQAIRSIADLRNRMPEDLPRREPGLEPLPNGATEGVVGVVDADRGAEAVRRAAIMRARIDQLREARQELADVQRAAERITERQTQLRAQALQLRALGQDPPAGVQGAAEINAEQHAQLRAQLRAQFIQLRALAQDPPAGVERVAEPAAEQSALRARILGIRRPVGLAGPGQLPLANGEVAGDLDQAAQQSRVSAARLMHNHRHGEHPLAEVAGALERATQQTREARARILQQRRPIEIDRTRNNVVEWRDRGQQQRIEAEHRVVERRAQVLRQREEAERQIAELRTIAQRPVPEALPQLRDTNQPRPIVQGQPPAYDLPPGGFARLRAELRQQRERLLRSQADMVIASVGLENLRNRLTQERESLERPQSQTREPSQVRLPASARERSGSLERPLRDPIQAPHRRLIEHRLRWNELRRNRGRTRSLERRRSVSPISRPQHDPPTP